LHAHRKRFLLCQARLPLEARGTGAAASKVAKQVGSSDSKRRSDLQYYRQRWDIVAALDESDVRRAQLCTLRQLLLRQGLGFA
jgi:hypothetical protein